MYSRLKATAGFGKDSDSTQNTPPKQEAADNVSIHSQGSRPVTAGILPLQTQDSGLSSPAVATASSSRVTTPVGSSISTIQTAAVSRPEVARPRSPTPSDVDSIMSQRHQEHKTVSLEARNGIAEPEDRDELAQLAKILSNQSQVRVSGAHLYPVIPTNGSVTISGDLPPFTITSPSPGEETPFISESDVTPLADGGVWRRDQQMISKPGPGSVDLPKPRPTMNLDTATISTRSQTRPPLIKVSQSHLPGFHLSYPNSSDGAVTPAIAIPAPSQSSQTHRNLPNHDRKQHHGAARMRNKILAKELWMKDENAKDCFSCGESFSAFRRKHHCRTCGQIFDAKCTTLAPGSIFDQPGRVRICKPCEAMVYGTDDDSSVYSDDGDAYSVAARSLSPEDQSAMQDMLSDGASHFGESLTVGTPTMGIQMSRKQGNEAKRRSAIIEVDGQHHHLPRPSSSRSLKSLSGRPRSASHKRHSSKHGHMKSLRSIDNLAPFARGETETASRTAQLPAFHHDNIIDPDLAPFLSDEGSSGDEQPNIFAALQSSPGKGNTERSGFGGFFAAMRKGKTSSIDRGTSGPSIASRDADAASIASRKPKHSRKRTLSISTVQHQELTPRRSKSNSLLKGISLGFQTPAIQTPVATKAPPFPPNNNAIVIRSSAMKGQDAPPVELNRASMDHVRKLLRQLLQASGFARLNRWERALLPIMLKCTDDVNPDIQRNDDIDIRHYIKLKKIPGGKPGDTSYISGIVFTKNLALKSMPRSIPNPRIVLVTFAIEYARHQQHFMSLDPVISQEREYLRNLVKRILALNPHVLLVEKHVAGLALELLADANVAVVQNVKASVLSAVSRCTQTRLITSVDKLSLDPSHVGRCGMFDVKTYVHGRTRKTYVYLTGCQRDLGCTIVLRGANTEDLRRLKRIAEFMSYVVYNLKLETCVMRDEYVQIPSTSANISENGDNDSNRAVSPQPEEPSQREVPEGTTVSRDESAEKNQQEKADVAANGPSVAESSEPGELQSKRNETPTFAEDIVERLNTQIISSSPFVRFMQPYLLAKVREQETRLLEIKQIRDHYQPRSESEKNGNEEPLFQLVEPEMVHTIVENPSRLVKQFLYAVHSAEYDRTLRSYNTLKRQWESSCGSSTLFDPFNHQRIAVLYSMVNTKTSNPCIGPDVIALGFYAEHDLEEGFLPDITLGQYVEDLCGGAMTPCSALGCGEPMYHHHRQYVHAGAQMSVVMSKYPSRIRGMHNTILMWSSCRICGSETQVIPMSENTWKYSFGKYLELTFWSTKLHPRAHACPHDIHRDHVRYFGYNNVAIRVQYDHVMNHEIIVPKAVITWNVDGDLRLKNEQYLKFKSRLDKFMVSVKSRIESIHIDSVVPEKLDACRTELDRLRKKANDDHKFLLSKLQEKYSMSRYYEIIPMNRAGRAMHENSLAWDEIFNEFEKNFFPSERDIRRLAAIQLKKMFLDRDESVSTMTAVDEDEAAAVEMKDFKHPETEASPVLRRLSTMSPADTHQVLTSIVMEQHESEKTTGDDTSTLTAERNEKQEILPPSTPSTVPFNVADREDVKHLDLAVSIRASSPLLTKTTSGTESRDNLVLPDTLTQMTSAPPAVDTPQYATDPTSAAQTPEGSTSKLENEPGPQTESRILESRIPRPVDPNRQVTEQKLVAPPLVRSQSQPQHATSSSGIRTGSSSDIASHLSSTASTPSKADRLKHLISDPARALERRMVDRLTSSTFRAGRGLTQSFIPRSVPGSRQTRVSTLARHFEQISREFEKQRVRERQLRAERGRRAYPLASSKPVVEVYRNEQEAVQGQEGMDLDFQFPFSPSSRTSADNAEDDEPTPIAEAGFPPDRPELLRAKTTVGPMLHSGASLDEPDEPPSMDEISASETDQSDSETDQTFTDDVEELPGSVGTDLSPSSPGGSQLDLSVGDLPKHEKTSIMKLLTSFWSERSASGWLPLEYPFGAQEHVWHDSDIIIREDEPASIIALALSSTDYQAKLRQFRGQDPDLPDPEDDKTSIERNLLHPKNTNIRYAFQNRGVRAHCKIFFAESFDALRRKTGVAERFVESLSRCLKWDSKGGKTKSLFLKTLDDRFVLKSLSPVEVNAFFKLAPDYFFFIHQNLFTQLPSVIAKMFGLFQVTIRSPQSGIEFNWYMIVMENLFYDRSTNRRFDLKGSMRNRKIQSTGEADEVLLDENLVDIIFEKPIFVREHTMKTLKNSVYNDTLFLSKQNVMDYSLMAGFDDLSAEILVGIIDCIRTYTWDKKLETWIKDRGKNKPTVTSPKDYRNRFRIAMSKYILHAPDCWHTFGPTGIPSAALSQLGQIKSGRIDMEGVARTENAS